MGVQQQQHQQPGISLAPPASSSGSTHPGQPRPLTNLRPHRYRDRPPWQRTYAAHAADADSTTKVPFG